jgi:hypothetical protein
VQRACSGDESNGCELEPTGGQRGGDQQDLRDLSEQPISAGPQDPYCNGDEREAKDARADATNHLQGPAFGQSRDIGGGFLR